MQWSDFERAIARLAAGGQIGSHGWTDGCEQDPHLQYDSAGDVVLFRFWL
jgi:hypothetical protein